MLGTITNMSPIAGTSPRRGLTLIEILVTVAILAIVLGLGIPSMREWMMKQRVSSIAAELVTDLQLARSEAIRTNLQTSVKFNSNATQTCYTIYTGNSFGASCDCTKPIGTACGASVTLTEIKTVSVPRNTGVTISANQTEKLLAGGVFSTDVTPLLVSVSDGGTRTLSVQASAFIQRPSVCVPSGSTMTGVHACP